MNFKMLNMLTSLMLRCVTYVRYVINVLRSLISFIIVIIMIFSANIALINRSTVLLNARLLCSTGMNLDDKKVSFKIEKLCNTHYND